MRQLLLIIVILIIGVSCKRQSTVRTDSTGRTGALMNVYTVVPDTFVLNTPGQVKAGPPVRLAAKRPDVFPTHSNVQPVLQAKTTRLGVPEVLVPGENGFPAPLTTQWTDSFITAGIPEPVPVREAFQPVNNPYSFSFYTRRQGMQHDDISCMIQDSGGNIWLGTYGGGAIRYDGLNFYHYTVNEGLEQNHILSMMEDSRKNIWMGTRGGGALKFDGRFFYHYSTATGLADDRIEFLFEDSTGRIWLGTYNGVSCIDGEDITHYYSVSGNDAEVVYTISEDPEGNLWFGTRGGGISRFDGTRFVNYRTPTGIPGDYIVASTTDGLGNIWFATDGYGVFALNGEHIRHYDTDNGLADNFITVILADRGNGIWIGTRSSGLVKLDNNNFTVFDENQGLVNEFITALLEDRNGKIWFGSYGGGFAQYNGDLFMHYNEKQGLKDGFVRSIYQDTQGYLWFGTNRGGVFRFDEKDFYNYTTLHGMPGSRVSGIVQDSKGKFWLSTTAGGLVGFDGRYFEHYGTEQGLVDDLILSMIIDENDNLWMATRYDGIVKFDGTYFTNYRTEHGLNANDARVIRNDAHGGYWIGTGSAGICYFDGANFLHYGEKQGFLHDNVLDLTLDSEGVVWIATNGRGVIRMENNLQNHYTELEGLLSNVVYSVFQDSKENIWFGTRMGLSRLQLNAEGGQNVLFKSYNADDGFIGMGSNSRAILEDNRGRIWIGANDVLTAYNPWGDSPDTITPRVEITTVGLFNEQINWAQMLITPLSEFTLSNGVTVSSLRFDGISPWYGLPENLSLAHNNNFVSFGFVGITTYFGRKIRYQYMLEGFDEQWSSPSLRTEVSYGNLSPGKYTFLIRAINSEGFVSETAMFSFHVRHPWWASWWAYLTYIMMAGLVVLLIMHQRILRKQEKEDKTKRELALEQEVAIARKSARFKQNFLASMSHEIRTPLTGILGMASMLNRLPLDEVAREYVGALNQAGENLRETINMILDISKIEAGKLQLKESEFSLQDIFEHSRRLFTPLLGADVEMEIRMDSKIPDMLLSDHSRISQIVKNLLSNAVKFTRAGSITLSGQLHNRNLTAEEKQKGQVCVKVTVCDTGVGISEADQQKLFTPFFQTGKTLQNNMDGTGLGLAICKELTTLLGGQIGVESEPGKGSCFWFTFQAGIPAKTSLRNTEIPPVRNSVSLNVLLVEDKVVTQKVLTLMLHAMGHTVTLASNGLEALQKYVPDTYDIILMDIQMPEMDGITATKSLREKYEKLPPVIGLSANAFEGDREKYMQQGLDEYINKPMKETEFNAILHKLGLFQG